MLTEELLLAWWRLSRLPGIGNIALNDLRQRLPDVAALSDASADTLISEICSKKPKKT